VLLPLLSCDFALYYSQVNVKTKKKGAKPQLHFKAGAKTPKKPLGFWSVELLYLD